MDQEVFHQYIFLQRYMICCLVIAPLFVTGRLVSATKVPVSGRNVTVGYTHCFFAPYI